MRASVESAHTSALATGPRPLNTQEPIGRYCSCLVWQQDTLKTLWTNDHIPFSQVHRVSGWVKRGDMSEKTG